MARDKKKDTPAATAQDAQPEKVWCVCTVAHREPRPEGGFRRWTVGARDKRYDTGGYWRPDKDKKHTEEVKNAAS